MIGALLAAQILVAAPHTTIAYESVPPEVVRVQMFEWHTSRPGLPSGSDRTPGRVTVRGTPHRVYVVTFARADGSYLLDGPFSWPAGDGVRGIPQRWHRTLRGPVPDVAAVETSVEWIRADALPGPWPMCFRDDSRSWSCWGILPESRGVVLLPAGDGILWTTITSTAPAALRHAAWGRLLIVTDSAASPGLRIRFGRPVAPPAGRVAGIRLETASVAGARAVPLAPGSQWVVGDDVPAEAWVEIASQSGGPVYLALQDVADGAALVPLQITLSERRVIDGRVLGANGEAASGTLVTAFRLIEPPPVAGSPGLPRRVLAAESVADPEGRFRIDGLGEADYEAVAWHSQLGRASVALPPGGSEVVIHLRASGLARGRVLAGGRPVEGVDVISVPDAAAFTAASDITVVKGGDGRTGPDGRFIVMVVESGGGELRIGGGKYPVKRVPLPRPPVPVFDAGDVELGESIALTAAFDRDPGCDVRAAGPVGRTGLQVVLGARTAEGAYAFTLPESGLWEFSLACVGERRSLSPAAVPIGPAQAGKELRFVVR